MNTYPLFEARRALTALSTRRRLRRLPRIPDAGDLKLDFFVDPEPAAGRCRNVTDVMSERQVCGI
jgi:hypothetical protein